MLTPLDIQNAAFHRAWRGYNEEEVDEFLDKVVLEYEALYRENQELKEKLANQQGQPGKGTIVSSTSQPIPDLSDLSKSSEIIAEAQRRAEELIAQAQRQVAKEKVRLEELKQQRRMFKEQFQSMLQTFFHILKNHEDSQLDSTLIMKNPNQDYQAEASAGSEPEKGSDFSK